MFLLLFGTGTLLEKQYWAGNQDIWVLFQFFNSFSQQMPTEIPPCARHRGYTGVQNRQQYPSEGAGDAQTVKCIVTCQGGTQTIKQNEQKLSLLGYRGGSDSN